MLGSDVTTVTVEGGSNTGVPVSAGCQALEKGTYAFSAKFQGTNAAELDLQSLTSMYSYSLVFTACHPFVLSNFLNPLLNDEIPPYVDAGFIHLRSETINHRSSCNLAP